jgi:hypothetical protein
VRRSHTRADFLQHRVAAAFVSDVRTLPLLLLPFLLCAIVVGSAQAQSPPSASILTQPPSVTEAGGTSYEFTVQYEDDGPIVTTTIDNNDVRVGGPRGFDVPAELVSFTPNVRPFATAPVKTTYRITPPGGSWDASDNGTYELIMQPDQVTDRLGQPVPAGLLARFSVAIPGAGPPPAQPMNISTRGTVQTGDNVMIGGFIISGTQSKKVVVRAVGPTLAQFGVSGVLPDPFLDLRGAGGTPITTNNNWKDNQQTQIQASGLAPQNDAEAAILATLPPGPYTAIVSGNGVSTGIGLIEVYDVDPGASARLANISTRGFVGTQDNVMIGGFILGNSGTPARVIIRAVGPSLTAFCVAAALADPTLDLRDANGTRVLENNNWRDTQQTEIVASGLRPDNELEAAIVAELAPGSYTAIVRGNNATTGVALVEVYQVP